MPHAAIQTTGISNNSTCHALARILQSQKHRPRRVWPICVNNSARTTLLASRNFKSDPPSATLANNYYNNLVHDACTSNTRGAVVVSAPPSTTQQHVPASSASFSLTARPTQRLQHPPPHQSALHSALRARDRALRISQESPCAEVHEPSRPSPSECPGLPGPAPSEGFCASSLLM